MDEHPTDELVLAIGGRVRHERRSRRWTLDRLAGAAGVGRRTLVNVEQGTANPSIGTLSRISDALGVGLPALVEPPQPRTLRITRSGDGAALWRGEGGGCGVLVAGTRSSDVVELWDWTLGPGDRHDSEGHAPGTQELVQVQAGAVTFEVGEQSIALTAGDAAVFAGDAPHAYANVGDEFARFALTVFEPGVGSTPRSEVEGG